MKFLPSPGGEGHALQGGPPKARPWGRIFLVLCVAVMATAAILMVASAAGTSTTITTGVKNGAQQLFNLMESVVVPVAAVCFAWNAFKVLFGGERGMEQAKKNILIIVLVLALVFLAPPIVKEVGGWFNSGGSQWSQL